jgi:hypothetical protein
MRRTAFFLLSALALAVCMSACGGKSTLSTRATAPRPAGGTPQAGAPQTDALRNTLRLSVPALASLQPGAEFDVQLSAEMAEPLFQASARLLFDPAVVQPVSAQRGAGLPGDCVFLCSTDKTLDVAGLAGVEARPTGARAVPFAFTGLPGQSALAPGNLKLLTVRFRVTRAVTGDAGLKLLNDPHYLQLRGPDARRLSFDLATEAGAR